MSDPEIGRSISSLMNKGVTEKIMAAILVRALDLGVANLDAILIAPLMFQVACSTRTPARKVLRGALICAWTSMRIMSTAEGDVSQACRSQP